MPKCLVTGGGGFIGSHLVDALLAEGHEVRVFDNFSTGDRRNLLHVAGEIEIVEGDLRSFERAVTAVKGCETVFHEAALPSVPRSVQDPLTSSEVNITGTLNLLLAARDAGVRRVVYASSSSVYGAASGEARREDLAVAPLSPYGVSKYAGEAYCRSFFEVYGLETVSLRYFNVFGPRQNPISEYAAVIPSFFAAALMKEEATIYGDGEQSRDFTYVGNVIAANLKAAAAKDAAGQVFNIATGTSSSINALLQAVSETVGSTIPPLHLPPRPGEVLASRADIGKARQVLNYEPKIDLTEGLAMCHEYFAGDPGLIPKIHERRKWIELAT